MKIKGVFGQGICLHFVASMFSGFVTTLASMPVDIAKTRFVFCFKKGFSK